MENESAQQNHPDRTEVSDTYLRIPERWKDFIKTREKFYVPPASLHSLLSAAVVLAPQELEVHFLRGTQILSS